MPLRKTAKDEWVKPISKPESPEPPQSVVKDDTLCTVEGCLEKKAPAQTYVCAKHTHRD